MMIALIINSVLLLTFTAVLGFLAVKGINLKRVLHAGLERLSEDYRERRLQEELKRYKRGVTLRMNLVEKVELYLVDKSNIRHYIPFVNFHTLAVICVLIFAAAFAPVYRILLFVPSTLVICFLFSMVPAFLLDLMGRYNSEKVRRKLAEFISVLNRWCAVKEDIFYAFEKSVDSNIGMPLKIFIRDMVIQVNRGIDPMEALDMLMLKVDNVQFRDFVVNIKQNIKHRGDIRKLLDNLENQFYKLEEEYNRRRISTYKDRLLTYTVMFMVLFTGYFFLKSNPQVREFYMETLEGKSLLTLFSLLYTGGFSLSLGIMKFKY